MGEDAFKRLIDTISQASLRFAGVYIMKKRYQLRCAAGEYWLLDMEQTGESFVPPVILNRTGADIWQAWQEGALEEQVLAMLCGKYGLSREQAEEDYRQFMRQAGEQGLL